MANGLEFDMLSVNSQICDGETVVSIEIILKDERKRNMDNKSHDSECCPIIVVRDLISAKWTVEILRELAIQPTRTRQFLARIPGLSMKCLVERLKELERYGMLVRIEFDEKVLHVEYAITERGRKLFAILNAMKELASEFMEVSCKCPMEHGASQVEFIGESAECSSPTQWFECPLRRRTSKG